MTISDANTDKQHIVSRGPWISILQWLQGGEVVLTKWYISLPLSLCVKRGLSSAAMIPLPVHWRILPHRFVFPLLHILQSLQKACVGRHSAKAFIVNYPLCRIPWLPLLCPSYSNIGADFPQGEIKVFKSSLMTIWLKTCPYMAKFGWSNDFDFILCFFVIDRLQDRFWL